MVRYGWVQMGCSRRVALVPLLLLHVVVVRGGSDKVVVVGRLVRVPVRSGSIQITVVVVVGHDL